MSKTKKILTLGSLSLMAATQAFAAGGGTGFTPMIEIAAGPEVNTTGVSAPCTVQCGGPNHGDDRRGGPMIKFGFAGITASELMSNNVGVYHMKFIPISMIVDTGDAQGDAFGRVVGHDGRVTHIRQVIGALVDANYNPASGLISLRGKLARVEYNRDKGIWDWRAIDASVGLAGAVQLGGSTTLNLEVSVGGGIGGVHLNGMEDVSKALDMAPPMTGAYTVNPYAMVRTGLHSPSLKIELIGSAEERVDLTPSSSRPSYYGRSLNVSSRHYLGTAEVEYTFGGKGLVQNGSRFSIFVDGTADVDTLTLSNMMFGSNDTFRSFMLMGGLRIQF